MYKYTSIGEILKNKVIKVNKPKKYNFLYEEAVDFLKYVGIENNKKNIVCLLGLFKRFGPEKILGLKSWLKDYKYDPKRVFGLMVWKLKNLTAPVKK